MSERLLPVPLELLFSGGAGLVAAGIPNMLPDIFRERPLMNAELGIGVSSLIMGIASGVDSNFEAVELAKAGQTRRAYLEVLKGAFCTAICSALSFASFGALVNKDLVIPGLIVGASFSVVACLGFGLYQVHKGYQENIKAQSFINRIRTSLP